MFAEPLGPMILEFGGVFSTFESDRRMENVLLELIYDMRMAANANNLL